MPARPRPPWLSAGSLCPGRLAALVLGLLHLVAVAVLAVPAPFSVDEVGYAWQAQALAGGRFAVVNGEGALAVEATEVHVADMLLRHDGVLQGKFPPGQALLAAPLHPWLGDGALVLLNALATLGLAAGTWALARRLDAPPRVGAVALLVLFAGTQAWGYSLDLWPHALAAALETGAFVLALGAGPGRRAAALGAGALLGLAVLVRLDAVLAAAPVAAAVWWGGRPRGGEGGGAGPGGGGGAGPHGGGGAGPGGGGGTGPRGGAVVERARGLLTLALGAAPAVLLLSWANHARFGLWSPLRYGGSPDLLMERRFHPLLAGLLGLALLLGLRGRARLVAGGLAAAAVALAAPDTVAALAEGVWTLLVDLRTYPADAQEPALVRGPAGELVYAGQVKLALLQGAPVLAAAAWGAWAPGARRHAALWLLAVLLLGFGRTAWHGGLCFNLRYLLPALPGAAVAAAFALEPWWRGRAPLVLAGALLGLGLALFAPAAARSTLPLGLAAALLLAGGAARAGLVRAAFAALLGAAALGWGAGVSGQQLAAARRVRLGNAAHAEALRPSLPPRAVVWTATIEAGALLHDQPGVVLSAVTDHDVRALAALRAAAEAEGVPLYAALPEEGWAALARAGLLHGVALERQPDPPPPGLDPGRPYLYALMRPAPPPEPAPAR